MELDIHTAAYVGCAWSDFYGSVLCGQAFDLGQRIGFIEATQESWGSSDRLVFQKELLEEMAEAIGFDGREGSE